MPGWRSPAVFLTLGGTSAPLLAGFLLVLAGIADSVAYEMTRLQRLAHSQFDRVFLQERGFPTNFFFPYELGVLVFFLLAVPFVAGSVWAVAMGHPQRGRAWSAIPGSSSSASWVSRLARGRRCRAM